MKVLLLALVLLFTGCSGTKPPVNEQVVYPIQYRQSSAVWGSTTWGKGVWK